MNRLFIKLIAVFHLEPAKSRKKLTLAAQASWFKPHFADLPATSFLSQPTRVLIIWLGVYC